MARSIQEIKALIGAEFVSNRSIREAYAIKDANKTFAQLFSPVSVESIMFHAVASAMWLLEKLFDRHREDVDSAIAAMRPHTLRWYVERTLEYMRGLDPVMSDGVTASDSYDTEGMTDDEIEQARVVKYAVASEDSSRVYVKVAGADADGRPTQLSADDYAGVCHYLSQIKDAGVNVTVLNEPADRMNVELFVMYDPAVLTAKATDRDGIDGLRTVVLSGSSGEDVVARAVNEVVTRLPFNGEYRNSDLLAAVQAVEGIRVADLVNVEAAPGDSDLFTRIVGSRRPSAGYYSLNSLTVRGRAYDSAE